MDPRPDTPPDTSPHFEVRPPTTPVWQASAPAPEPTARPTTGQTPPRPAAPGAPAQWGWRGRANRLAGLTLPAGRPEILHRAARRRLLQPFRRTMTVVVANPKGGAAKTPTTLLTAATLGHYRGGYTLAWDNNETRGTLGIRAEETAHRRTVVDLLRHVEDFVSGGAGAGTLSGFLRPQTARFDVLASDDRPGAMDVIDDDAFRRLWTALSRYYRILVIDTGNNVRAPNWRAATELADCLIVPTTVAPDVADSGLWMLHHLIRSGHGELAANAVAVVSCADPKTDPTQRDQIVAAYRTVVRDVVVIPHDPHLRSGSRIEYDTLAVTSRRAWLLACTSIIDSLALRDQD